MSPCGAPRSSSFPGAGRGPVTTTSDARLRPSPEKGKGGKDHRRVTLAVITGAHGTGGEVKLKLFTDDLLPYRIFNDGALTLTSLRGPIARFAEIPDRAAAERLRGTELIVPRSALPLLAEGEYYHVDLIGLPCETEAGEPIGHVVAVENFGAGDILDIERPDGKRFMVPVSVADVGERIVVNNAFAE